MTISKIIEKIQVLESWLIKNPDSAERQLIEYDLKKLQTILQLRQNESKAN
ncbi:hypothetical protein ACHRVW_19760 [Flavobacterium collinsii]|jgi:hypothetical protein|uniref:Uncharacterized protein n=1 Tax=Flavobacterium collinsii TaxID=1114861 RepID=A0ABM8KQ49_9FLAO|nr:hypothetical protein [Flavobacterium collinsii]GIQ57191.1 hypothetical protein Flavo103_03270 [Flavobacterium collinsii]CAA9203269.1 hypothetical protein FLACOL7796_04668 [Flavobacterium collinsii]